jgi:hypothetical protein
MRVPRPLDDPRLPSLYAAKRQKGGQITAPMRNVETLASSFRLQAPARQILTNAGEDGSVIVGKSMAHQTCSRFKISRRSRAAGPRRPPSSDDFLP